MPERMWTPAQRTAIDARARTLVAAAAGSGKTSVLTELVATALVAREVAPSEVCAVTFTEKAAQEMRGRIAARLADMGERELLSQLELARIGTIHSLCSTVLRAHGAAVGIDPSAGVFDEAQSVWLYRETREAVLRAHAEDPDVHWLRARIGDEKLGALLDDIRRRDGATDIDLTLHEATSGDLPRDRKTGEPLVTIADARRAHAAICCLRDAWRDAVRQRQLELGRLTFDDLERHAVAAVRIPEVRAALRARWTMVLVDEFQDTNERQYELLDTIGGARLFMVGDEWQSIYRFRGADVDVFRARRAATDTVIVPMRENFRSSGPVLDVVNRIFAADSMFGEGYEAVIPGTDGQRSAIPPAVELLVVPTDPVEGASCTPGSDRRVHEAMRVAERVAELVEGGHATPGDIAILYARGTGVDHYEEALRAWGLPVLRGASDGYYDQRDVRDVLALLALLRNRRDDHAAASVLGGPVGSLEWSDLDALVTQARAEEGTLLASAAGSELAGARRVIEVLDALAAIAAGGSLVELVAAIIALPELELGAAQEVDGLVRVANLRRLVDLASSAEAIGSASVSQFLEFVAAQRRDARVGAATVADESVGAVRLLTIHASKGLEFPYVFVIEAGQGGARAASVPSSHVDEAGQLHVGIATEDGRFVRTNRHTELSELDSAAAEEETLRLWYVAMTRAQRQLLISGRWSFEPTKANKPRAVGGALRWLRDTLDCGDFFGGVGHRTPALDGLVTIDTNPARRTPTTIWHAAERRATLARPLVLPAAVTAPALAEPDRHALRAALRDAVAAARRDDWRQLDGTRVHDAVARLLDAVRAGVPIERVLDPEQGPWLTDSVRARLEPVVASASFRGIARLGARTEVPYVLGGGEVVESHGAPGISIASSTARIDAGRIDAFAQLDDGRWWIIDWKTTVADAPADAWVEHGDQLARYARVARAAGALGALVTLVPLGRPEHAHTWAITDVAAPGEPPRSTVPSS